MLPKALIFDVDGTLAETEELHRRAFNETFTWAGLPWSWDRVLYAELLETTGGKERIGRYIDGGARPALDTKAIAKLHRFKTDAYAKLVSDGRLTLRPGIKRLIKECQEANVRLAIATTTSKGNVDALLEVTLGCQPFEVIAAGDEVDAKKPAPDVYNLALERLALPPGECIAFEDTLNGLLSATRAGLPCVMTISVYGGAGPFPGALAVVDQLGDAQHPANVLAGAENTSAPVTLELLATWLEARRPR